MNAVVACLFSNLLMNELGLGIFLSCLLCQLVVFLCIRKTLPSPFPFCRILELFHLCTHSNSVTLFLSVLAPWCRTYISLFFISFMSHCLSFASPSLLWVVFVCFTFGALTQSLLLVPLCPSHIPMMRVRAATSVLGH